MRTHPDIADAAVIGIPDARCGEVPRAFVVLKKDHSTTEENIQNYMKGKVSEFKELKGGVKFINQIPRNATGKILRISLKSQSWGDIFLNFDVNTQLSLSMQWMFLPMKKKSKKKKNKKADI